MTTARTTALSWPTAASGGAAASATVRDVDCALVAAAQGGDLEAFEILFRRHRPTMLQLASRFLVNGDDADEAVTDAFVRAYRALPSFRGDAQFATWLYRITVNLCIRRQRKARGEAAETVSIDDPNNGVQDELVARAGVEALVEERTRRRTVRHAVNTLSPKLRAVVTLHYFEDMSCERIAEVLGVSVGTVWSRIHAAKRRLSSMLAGEL